MAALPCREDLIIGQSVKPVGAHHRSRRKRPKGRPDFHAACSHAANLTRGRLTVTFKMPYMLAVREDHRFAKRQAVTLSDLANEPFILA